MSPDLERQIEILAQDMSRFKYEHERLVRAEEQRSEERQQSERQRNRLEARARWTLTAALYVVTIAAAARIALFGVA